MSERPIECSECKRVVKVTYKEITLKGTTCTEMCSECPVLKSKLHGDLSPTSNKESHLCCGICGTSLESVKMGQPLGCAECYSAFADFVVSQLISTASIPLALQKKAQAQRLQTLHIGKSPHQSDSLALSSKLASLNEALNDALKKENYEQAAYLRDQIKAMMDHHE